ASRVCALVVGPWTLLGLLPIGVGVREATLSVILTPSVGLASATIIAVLYRLLYLAGDLFWGTVLLVICRRFAGVPGGEDNGEVVPVGGGRPSAGQGPPLHRVSNPGADGMEPTVRTPS